MKKVARALRRHRELILNGFRTKGELSSGIVEGLNNKVKLTTRKAYGFRTYEAYPTKIHSLSVCRLMNLDRLATDGTRSVPTTISANWPDDTL